MQNPEANSQLARPLDQKREVMVRGVGDSDKQTHDTQV